MFCFWEKHKNAFLGYQHDVHRQGHLHNIFHWKFLKFLQSRQKWISFSKQSDGLFSQFSNEDCENFFFFWKKSNIRLFFVASTGSVCLWHVDIIAREPQKRLCLFTNLSGFIVFLSHISKWPHERGLKTTFFWLNSKSPWKHPMFYLISVFCNKKVVPRTICGFLLRKNWTVTTLDDEQDSCQFYYFPC